MALTVKVRGHRIKATWQTLVGGADFMYGYYVGGELIIRVVRTVFPAIRLTGTSFNKIESALTNHHHTKPIERFRQCILHEPKMALDFGARDDASSNRKLMSMRKHLHPKQLQDSFPCSNHQNWISEEGTLSAVFPNVLKQQFAIANFINTGTHMVRCCVAAYSWAFAQIRFQVDGQSFADELFAVEFVQYLKCWDEKVPGRSGAPAAEGDPLRKKAHRWELMADFSASLLEATVEQL